MPTSSFPPIFFEHMVWMGTHGPQPGPKGPERSPRAPSSGRSCDHRLHHWLDGGLDRKPGKEGGWIQRNLYWELIPLFPTKHESAVFPSHPELQDACEPAAHCIGCQAGVVESKSSKTNRKRNWYVWHPGLFTCWLALNRKSPEALTSCDLQQVVDANLVKPLEVTAEGRSQRRYRNREGL